MSTTLTTIAHDLPQRAIASALSGLSAHSRRVYQARISAWLKWSGGGALDRENVKAYMRTMELQGSSAQVRNQVLAALKRLAVEAGELGWIEHNAAMQVQSISAQKITGIRTGRWLTTAQSASLLQAPDRTSTIGKRDACAIALLLGCGLRRSEACALTVEQLITTGDRTIIANLVGKGGRIRSVAVPVWALSHIQDWICALAVPHYHLLRSVNQNGTINGSLSVAAIRDIVRKYGTMIGVPDLAPHDIRRTCARLARLGGAPLETIQHTLGHANVKTTELYTRTGEEANAGDFIRL